MGRKVLPKNPFAINQHIRTLGLHTCVLSLLYTCKTSGCFINAHCPGCREYQECLAACPTSLAPAAVSEMHRRAAALVGNVMHSLRRYKLVLHTTHIAAQSDLP